MLCIMQRSAQHCTTEMKTKNLHKPTKRTSATLRSGPKKTCKKGRKTRRPPVKRGIGRAEGFLPMLRKQYENAREAVVKNFDKAAERLAQFYNQNRETIHTAGKVALGALGAGALGYGAHHLRRELNHRDNVDDAVRELQGALENENPGRFKVAYRDVPVDLVEEIYQTPRRTSDNAKVVDSPNRYANFLAQGKLEAARSATLDDTEETPRTARASRNRSPYANSLVETVIEYQKPVVLFNTLRGASPIRKRALYRKTDNRVNPILQTAQRERTLMALVPEWFLDNTPARGPWTMPNTPRTPR